MDKRSWPWKKKSSDKSAALKAGTTIIDSNGPAESTGSQGDPAKQENDEKPKYVQISVESYSHLTGLEDEVKSYEEQVKALEVEVEELNEKLSSAHSEMANKETVVKQHAKVAEEAVSGWEKAEAEATALKNHLESVTLLKLTAEDRASHLDGALKECMRQIRNLKEEHEHNLREVALSKTKQFDKMKLELEAKIAELDQELLRSAAENAALSRSLQERSNMLIKLSEEKSQAEGEIELLRNNISSCEKEINMLKYELHVVAKELEIRNEEKDMSVRSAEVANKQHLEGVKKIAKLEAECQRLRGLVRKKLPGPAALAQMKLEVENLGRDSGGTRMRRPPLKSSNPHMSLLPEYSFDDIQKFQKENEVLTECLLTLEEEGKMLKEALARCNSELQASKSNCAKTTSKLRSLEAQLLSAGEGGSPLKPVNDGIFSLNASSPPSLTSLSEDGNDDDSASCLVSRFKKEKSIDGMSNVENASHLELMDDFLEMEKLACQSNGSLPLPGSSSNLRSETVNHDTIVEVTPTVDNQLKGSPEQKPSGKEETSKVEVSVLDTQPDAHLSPLIKLQDTISMMLESMSKEAEKQQFLEDARCILQGIHDNIKHQSSSCTAEPSQILDAKHKNQTSADDIDIIGEKEMSLAGEGEPGAESLHSITPEVVAAISQIHDFVLLIGKEAEAALGKSQERPSEKLDEVSSIYNAVVNGSMDLTDFVLGLALFLTKVSELRLNALGYKDSDAENGSSDCIDKVALPEDKNIQVLSGAKCRDGCPHFSDLASDLDSPCEGDSVPTSESRASSWKCSLEEFEQLKQEKDDLLRDLAKCTESLESTKCQLQETEELLTEVKFQLSSAQKMHSLAETQLKCMTESYKSLETHAEELQREIDLLHAKSESLDNDLQEEKRSHQDDLAKYKNIKEQLQRMESGSAAETDTKTGQDMELAAAAQKLAECQETIMLLGRQLKTFRPQTELVISEGNEKIEGFIEDGPTRGDEPLQDADPSEMDTAASVNLQKTGCESPRDLNSTPFRPLCSEVSNPLRSPISSKQQKHHSGKSGSFLSVPSPTREKHSRGFGRFFSSKGKSGN